MIDLNINITQRIEWLENRIELSSTDKDYIAFQMKEIVNETIKNIMIIDKKQNHNILSSDDGTRILQLKKQIGNLSLELSKIKQK